MAELLVKIPSKREDLQKSKEQDAISEPVDAEPVKSFISEVPADVTGKESVQEKSTLARPLSPYTMYDDLKLPSSPCPTPPSGQGKKIEHDGTEPITPDTPTIMPHMKISSPLLHQHQQLLIHWPLLSTTLGGAESQMVGMSNNGARKPVEAQNAGDEQTPIQPKSRPLSVYYV